MPEKIHIGTMKRFIMPEIASIVLARLAIKSPMPENIVAPSSINSVTANTLPWFTTPKAYRANTKSRALPAP